MARLKVHQWGELFGVLFLLASTAAQIFYVDPLKREIEWRLAAFNTQQNAQIQTQAIYDNRIALLKGMNAGADAIATAEKERDAILAKYKTADANISDYLMDKEPVEDYLQIIVLALFAVGSLLAGFGRAMEMVAGNREPR